jgi:hypothetical protein
VRIWLRRTLNIGASLVVPFLVHGVIAVIAARRDNPLPTVVLDYAPFVSAGCGFVWLVAEFGFYALPTAVIYFPVMIVALTGFSIGLAQWLTHEAL